MKGNPISASVRPSCSVPMPKNRVTRIHNRFLRNRFEDQLDALVDTNDNAYKRSLEYLFYGENPKLPGELKLAVEDGFRNPADYAALGLDGAVCLTNSVSLADLPRVLQDKASAWRTERRYPGYREARARLVADPAWAEMLRYNPIRAEHEYRWFLESRFPGRTVQTLDVGRHSRILAFDSGPVTATWFPPQSYP